MLFPVKQELVGVFVDCKWPRPVNLQQHGSRTEPADAVRWPDITNDLIVEFDDMSRALSCAGVFLVNRFEAL